MRRVLAAADLSDAAAPTLEFAQRFARLVGAELRVLSVVEPLPTLAGVPPAAEAARYYARCEELLQRDIWPLVTAPRVEKVVRHGRAAETLIEEAVTWSADVLVVGSEGRSQLGGVAERLLNEVPMALLVIPAPARERRETTPVANGP
jgi:nucleotide-binding universal stress UspA family protein